MHQETLSVRPARASERLVAAAWHAVRVNWRLVLLSLVATFSFILVLASKTKWDLGGVWGAVQNVGTCLTLVVAFLVWVGELHGDWIESLPKRLTVRFTFEEKDVMVCEGAYLAGESDIRAWAQQLGGQMSDDQGLKFFPSLEQSDREILHDMKEDRLVVHYTVSVKLRTLPQTLKTIGDQPEDKVYPLVHWKRPDFLDERYRAVGGAPKRQIVTGSA